ncbi:phage tail sheath subtilisin-like domain-containing protein [Clostridium sp. D33t1_170424_F3]|uniref:phage tail sheath subtilisin-like domain-containing protein n=1 Tax=Clostridium sp. D33t1_170424_F3 TaxID=2787099 RepID=UPI0018A8C203|nr:phage tail sheath subtilisin-like domain-containing protein [Clostridium sp. D33t1_170424_F3]
MAGGTFDKLAGKVRPGTYINFESTRQDTLGIGERGTVLLPLIGHSYGPEKQFITITSGSPDANIEKLGYSVYDDNPSMLLIREALKNAREVILYIPKQGARATASSGTLTATAAYGGSRGNDLKFSIVANPSSGFDVTVYLGADVVSEHEGVADVAALAAQEDGWIEFTGTGELAAAAGVSLVGGTDGSASNSDITTFLDEAESVKWNTMAFPLAAETGSEEGGGSNVALHEAVKTKIKYLREEVGKYRKAVIPGFDADYEGIINVTNAPIVNGVELTPAQATAWIAGIDAAALNTKSNTYAKYSGATGIVGVKNHAAAVAAINNGELFFSYSEEGDVVVEYDINSLVTFDKPKDATYRKNRVLRVFDTFGEAVMLNFPPNKYDNSPTGWDIMEGIGRTLLKQFFEAGALKNVDYDNDFLVDRGASTGDQTYFTVGLEPVDSAEKLFFTIKTR